MALLLLSLVLNPVVAYVGDIHALNLAPVASYAEAVDHHHDETALVDSDHEDDRAGDALHRLMHVDHAHVASTAAFFVSMVAVVPHNRATVFPPTAPLSSLQHFAGPFRPPIV